MEICPESVQPARRVNFKYIAWLCEYQSDYLTWSLEAKSFHSWLYSWMCLRYIKTCGWEFLNSRRDYIWTSKRLGHTDEVLQRMLLLYPCCCKVLWLYYLLQVNIAKVNWEAQQTGKWAERQYLELASQLLQQVCHNRCPTTELLCTGNLRIVKRMFLVAASSRWSSCVNLAERQESPKGVGHIHLNSVTLETL